MNDNQTIDLFGAPAEICTVEEDTETSGLEKMEDIAMSRYLQRHYHLIDKIAEIGLPAPGEQFRVITRRNFNAIQFVQYIADQEGLAELRMVIYSINNHAAQILVDLLTQHNATATLLVSNLRNKAHREKEELVKKMFVDHPNISLFFCSSHAKIFSCRTPAGNYYTLEGSGNMAYNSRIEQYSIDNDRGLWDFTCRWMDDIRAFLAGKKELEDCG